MLQTIRDKITGWVAGIFLGAIAIVFVFWGIDFGAGGATYAAKVDGESIPIETVQRAWQQQQSRLQQMLRDELPEELKKSQQAALLDQFVQRSLLTQRAAEFGYGVTDEALAKRVMEVPQFQVDGKFSKDRYNALLRTSGLTEAQFEADLETELLVDQLQNGVIDSAFVTDHELARRYAIEKQEREVNYALVAASDFAGAATITEEQVQKWYEGHKEQFLLPETVNLQYVELTRASAEGDVVVTDEALRDYYEQNKERFESPERRKARHILITAEDGLDDAAAQKKAEELAAKANGGADFAELARQNSKDPGSAQQGGDLGWAQRGMFVGPFEEALFAMKPGEIRGPVKTEFGYHVLKLDEVDAGRLKSFDEARAELEDEYRKDRAQTKFYDESQKLGDAAFTSLTELESVATSMKLPLKTVTGFTRQGGGELGAEPNVIEAAFSEEVLERGENSPLIAVGDDRAIVLRVTQHKPAEPRPFAEVRGQIESQLKAEAARNAAAAKGADALARLQKGESWDAVAADLKLTPSGKRFITREDAIAPEAVRRTAFSAPKSQIAEAKPHYAGAATADGNYAIVAVTQVRAGDPAAEAQEEKDARRRRVERQTGNEEFSGYMAEAERTTKIVKNEKVFE
jgi:peptidyl-prolyl cis-trans isomerase D